MKLMVCMPGNLYSGTFIECWTAFLAGAIADGIEVTLSRKHSPNIYFSRILCLGGDLRRGKNQLPFNGQPYDFVLWIDSDSYYSYDHFKQLLSHNLDIVAGYYAMEDGKHAAVVKEWSTVTLAKEGTMKFFKLGDFNGGSLISVSYAGMGFFLIKYGVLEALGYPWGHAPLNIDIGNAQTEFTTEDVSFCLRAQTAGFKVCVDSSVRVGHEKIKIL